MLFTSRSTLQCGAILTVFLGIMEKLGPRVISAQSQTELKEPKLVQSQLDKPTWPGFGEELGYDTNQVGQMTDLASLLAKLVGARNSTKMRCLLSHVGCFSDLAPPRSSVR